MKRKMFSAPVKAKAVLSARRAKSDADHEALTDRLYQRIGQFEVELDRLKKVASGEKPDATFFSR